MTAGGGDALAERVRHAIAPEGRVREVRMFGGLAFLLDERMLVSVGRDGDLLVRVDPARDPDLVGRAGARRAEMGAGRSMGAGWVTVSGDALDPDGLRFWLDEALRSRPAA